MANSARAWLSGSTVLAVMFTMYYATVVLAGLHLAILQLLALWGLFVIVRPRDRVALSRDEWILLASMVSIVLVATLSYGANDLWDHPDGNLSRYARFLFFVPIYMIVRRYVTARIFWGSLLGGCLVTGLWGLFEFAGLLRHPDDVWPEVSGGVNPIQFGDLTLVMSAMVASGLVVFLKYGTAWHRLAILSVCLGLFATLICNTRGAWVAMPGLGMIVVFTYYHHGFLDFRRIAVVILLAIAGLAVVMPHTQILPEIDDAINEIHDYYPGSPSSSDVGYRFELWRASWQIFRQYPWLGPGPGLFRTEAQKLLQSDGNYNAEALEFTQPLSEYFFVLATLGLIGMLALMLFYMVPLVWFLRAMFSARDEQRWLGLAGTLLVVGYLHFGLTEGLTFQHATFLGFYLLSIASIFSLTYGPRNPRTKVIST